MRITYQIAVVLVFIAVAVAQPVGFQDSPVMYVAIQAPYNLRITRNTANLSPKSAPGGTSDVKSDFSRKIRGARLHVADGAYPVYYTPGIANGRFGAKIFTLN